MNASVNVTSAPLSRSLSSECESQRVAFGALMGIFTAIFIGVCTTLGWYLIARAPLKHRDAGSNAADAPAGGPSQQ
jgi:hypothetical protein